MSKGYRSATDNPHASKDFHRAYGEGVNRGVAYLVGEEGEEDTDAAAAYEGWEVEHESSYSDDITVARKPDGTRVAIGYDNGCMAVDLDG